MVNVSGFQRNVVGDKRRLPCIREPYERLPPTSAYLRKTVAEVISFPIGILMTSAYPYPNFRQLPPTSASTQKYAHNLRQTCRGLPVYTDHLYPPFRSPLSNVSRQLTTQRHPYQQQNASGLPCNAQPAHGLSHHASTPCHPS